MNYIIRNNKKFSKRAMAMEMMMMMMIMMIMINFVTCRTRFASSRSKTAFSKPLFQKLSIFSKTDVPFLNNLLCFIKVANFKSSCLHNYVLFPLFSLRGAVRRPRFSNKANDAFLAAAKQTNEGLVHSIAEWEEK